MSRIEFRLHAFQRMATKRIKVAEVIDVLTNGQVIENYPDDTPFPSTLKLATVNGRPLHVVSGYDTFEDVIYVVTVYQPDLARWQDGFRRRR